jgi:hypothetical protein
MHPGQDIAQALPAYPSSAIKKQLCARRNAKFLFGGPGVLIVI